MERPANIYGSYGENVEGIEKPGIVHLLKKIYWDKYVECIKKKLPVKHALLLFKKEDDIADINYYLWEVLPYSAEEGELPDEVPVTNYLWNRLPNELKCATSQAIFENNH